MSALDLKIVGGTLIDGTGAERRRADIGIQDGRVVAVGEVPGHAAQTVDAGGLVVAPGFVDIHTHYDAQVLWDPLLTVSPWHGVTTAMLGNCGFGVAPTRPQHRDLVLRTLERVEGMSLAALEAGLGRDWPFQSFPEYMDALERVPLGINVAVMVGHTPVRLWVMGDEATTRAATGEEMRRCATWSRRPWTPALWVSRPRCPRCTSATRGGRCPAGSRPSTRCSSWPARWAHRATG